MNKKRTPEEIEKLMEQFEPEEKVFVLKSQEEHEIPTCFFNKPKKTYIPPHKKRKRRKS